MEKNRIETNRRIFLAGASAVTLAGVAGTAVGASAQKNARHLSYRANALHRG